MDKLKLYNLALIEYNIDPLIEEDLNNGNRYARILDLQIQTAIQKVAMYHPWTFLQNILCLKKVYKCLKNLYNDKGEILYEIDKLYSFSETEYENLIIYANSKLENPDDCFNLYSLDNIKSAKYVYEIPKNVFRITSKLINAYIYKHYLYSQNEYTEKLTYQDRDEISEVDIFNNENIPYFFWQLIAYQLAYICNSSLANNDTKLLQVVAGKYNELLQSSQYNDIIYNQGETIDDDGTII